MRFGSENEAPLAAATIPTQVDSCALRKASSSLSGVPRAAAARLNAAALREQIAERLKTSIEERAAVVCLDPGRSGGNRRR
jgi:hypothetical protein